MNHPLGTENNGASLTEDKQRRGRFVLVDFSFIQTEVRLQ
jgi:hypothetical protein